MLKAIVATISLSIFFASCRKPLSQFQKSSYESFEISKKEPKGTKEEILEIPNELIINEIKSEINTEPIEEPIVFNKETSIIIKSSKTKPKVFTYLNSDSFQETKEVSNSVDKRKKNLFFNDNIKIGAIFLGIAIGLSFFGLTQLTLIFGLASLVFIYLGLKKYYRRKRIRNFFNRKK